MQKQLPKTSLTFLHNPTNPSSLIMLYPPQQIVQTMIQQPTQHLFIWILEVEVGIQDQYYPTVEEILAKVKHMKGEGQGQGEMDGLKEEGDVRQVRVVGGVEELRGILANWEVTDVQVICSYRLVDEVHQLNRRKQISTIIEYPTDLNLLHSPSPSSSTPFSPQSPQFPQQCQTIKQPTKSSVFNYIKSQNNKIPSYRELMNFVSLSRQVCKSNILIRTMMAMINQDIDIETRRQIVCEFEKIVVKIEKDNSFQQLITQLKQGPLPLERAIYWYTHPIGLYKILNNLLRSSCHPCQIFSIQPIFKDIFSAINTLYHQSQPLNPSPQTPNTTCQLQLQQQQQPQKQPQYKQQEQTFICYRGGMLFEEEIEKLRESVGCVVKNLCFFSCSMDQETALLFMRNVMFEIVVQKDDCSWEQQSGRYDYGYANIKQYSYFYQQDQILFNPLNSFLLLQFTQSQVPQNPPIYKIKLQYGILSKIMKKHKKYPQNTSNSQQQQKWLYTLARMWKEEEKKMKNQGVVLVSQDQNLGNGVDYWGWYVQQWGKYQGNKEEKEEEEGEEKEKGDEGFRRAYGLVQLALAESNRGNYKVSQNLLLQAQSVLQQYQNIQQISQHYSTLTFPQISTIQLHHLIQRELAYRLLTLQNYPQSSQICHKSIKSLLKIFGPQHTFYQSFIHLLGNIFYLTGDYEKALQYYGQNVEFSGKFYGEMHPNFITALSDVGKVYRAMGRYQEAQGILWRCSRLLLMTLGDGHPDYLCSLTRLASTLLSAGQPQKSLQLLQKALLLSQTRLGQTHPVTITILFNYTLNLESSGNLTQAQQNYQICYKIQTEVYTKTQQLTSDYINTIDRLARVLLMLGRNQEALGFQRRCYQYSLGFFGEGRREFFGYLWKFGKMLRSLNFRKQAEAKFKHCCALRLKALDQNSPKYIIDLNDLAVALLEIKEYQKAVEYFEKSLAERLKVSGNKDSFYADTLSNLASALSAMGHHIQAQKIYQECVTIKSTLLPQTHPQHIFSLQNLSQCLQTQLKHKKSLQILQKCHSLSILSTNESHPLSLKIANNLVQLHLQLGEYQKGIEMQRRVCELIGVGKLGWSWGIGVVVGVMVGVGRLGDALRECRKVGGIEGYGEFIVWMVGRILDSMGEYRKSKKFMKMHSHKFPKLKQLHRKPRRPRQHQQINSQTYLSLRQI